MVSHLTFHGHTVCVNQNHVRKLTIYLTGQLNCVPILLMTRPQILSIRIFWIHLTTWRLVIRLLITILCKLFCLFPNYYHCMVAIASVNPWAICLPFVSANDRRLLDKLLRHWFLLTGQSETSEVGGRYKAMTGR